MSLFSLFTGTPVYPVFPDYSAELDNYLSTILGLALRFSSTGLYTYHILLSSLATGHLHQFNQGTYSGALESIHSETLPDLQNSLTPSHCIRRHCPSSSSFCPTHVHFSRFYYSVTLSFLCPLQMYSVATAALLWGQVLLPSYPRNSDPWHQTWILTLYQSVSSTLIFYFFILMFI